MAGSNPLPTVRPVAWHRALPPVTATIRCSGREHRLSWRAGRIVLHDHDLAAEVALRALGGRSCPCLDVVEATRRYLRRLGPSGLWAAEGDPTGLVLPAEPSGSRPTLPDVDDERRLDALRSLPAPFRRRLALAMFVAASRTARGVGSWQQPPFGRVLTSLVGPAVARSLAEAEAHHDRAGGPADGPDADTETVTDRRPPAGAGVDVRWTATGPGERPTLEGEVGPGGGWAHLRLSPAWVPEVWTQALTNIDGHLVLGVAGHDPASGRLLLHAARWRLAGPDSSGAGIGPGARWRPGPTTTISRPFSALTVSPRSGRLGPWTA